MKGPVLLFFVIVLASCQAQSDADLAPAAFKKGIDNDAAAVLIDVRTPQEVRRGSIKGQVNYDFYSDNFTDVISSLDKNKAYFVYCATGIRSAKAARQMRNLGFKRVYSLAGGIRAWQSAGLPVQ